MIFERGNRSAGGWRGWRKAVLCAFAVVDARDRRICDDRLAVAEQLSDPVAGGPTQRHPPKAAATATATVTSIVI